MSFIPADLLEFISREIIIRRLGTSIMDLCQVASGQYDVYLSLGSRMKLTDVCQPMHLLQQAGVFTEIKLFSEGKPCQELYDNYLRALLEEKEYDILNTLRFKLVAAGTNELGVDILKNISL